MSWSFKSHTVINDPLYGFVSIPSALIFKLLNHKYFQRLRRISQLGLTYLVYPGARHTRFEHALGAMHLTKLAIQTLRSKAIDISPEEEEGTLIAILLHDIGHGPFSHTLEKTIIPGVHHEDISLILMDLLNHEFDQKLSLAISIFKDEYPKKFLHQLVSSQLDMDRMDYLNRDCFYSGVTEGIVNYDRIINKLHVVNQELVVDVKGIYSVEKFITARRLMYWQVYLHKTTVGAENLITNILNRAKYLTKQGLEVTSFAPLKYFLTNAVSIDEFSSKKDSVETFVMLDDFDLMSEIKRWMLHKDSILRILCEKLLYRQLWQVTLSNDENLLKKVPEIEATVMKNYSVSKEDASFLFSSGCITNNAYSLNFDNIKIMFPNGSVKDITEAADLLNITALTKAVNKYYICCDKLN